MSEFRVDQIKSQDGKKGPNIAGITTFTSGVVLPSGDTFHRGGRDRAVFMGGYKTTGGNAAVADIHYVQISTLGNSGDFGDLFEAARWAGGCYGSSIRGFYGGGTVPASTNHIDFVTISATGNALDFGDLSYPTGYVEAAGNNVRGLWGGGRSAPSKNMDTIQYITPTSKGINSLEFGSLTEARIGSAAVANPTRALWTGGYVAPASNVPKYTIDYVNISTLGSAKDFGDLYYYTNYSDTASSGTRGIHAGGGVPSRTDIIQYIAFASLGNGQDFGSLTDSRDHLAGTDNSVRGIFAGGQSPSGGGTYVNKIDYITISTLGNAVEFGELSRPDLAYAGGCSDSHGGLA